MSDNTELQSLKERADLMGIKYSPNIGVEKLRAKVNQAIEGKPEEVEEEAPKASTLSKTKKAKEEAGKLVRVNVTCMNPAKREWDGEILTCGNSTVGTFRKFVKFNTTEGWHVPQIIINAMRERKFQTFTRERSKNGTDIKVGKLVNEFAIEVLPPLTQAELDELAKRQAARGDI